MKTTDNIEEFLEKAEQNKQEFVTHDEIKAMSNKEKLEYISILKEVAKTTNNEDLLINADQAYVNDVMEEIKEKIGKDYKQIRNVFEAKTNHYLSQLHYNLHIELFMKHFLDPLYYFMFPIFRPDSYPRENVIHYVNKWIEASFSVAGQVAITHPQTGIVLFLTPPLMDIPSERKSEMNKIGEAIKRSTESYERLRTVNPLSAEQGFTRNLTHISKYMSSLAADKIFEKKDYTWEDIFNICYGETEPDEEGKTKRAIDIYIDHVIKKHNSQFKHIISMDTEDNESSISTNSSKDSTANQSIDYEDYDL